jgi:hypothetical protein
MPPEFLAAYLPPVMQAGQPRTSRQVASSNREKNWIIE